MATAAERGHWTRTLGGDRREAEEAEAAPPAPRWHAGTDLGLLSLRLVLGAVFIGHGVRKLAMGFGEQGLGAFTAVLAGNGFHQPTVLAWLDAVTELAGGVLVLLGAATPLAAAVLLSLMLDAIWIRMTGQLPPDGGRGLELALVLAGAAAALVLTGGGRLAMDRRPRFFRRPSAALPCLLVGIGLAVAVRLLLHG